MATSDYTYTVGNVTSSPTIGNVTISDYSTTGSTSSCTVWGCNCSGHHYWWYPYTPAPIKLYQIFCPKPGCTGKFWAEIDEIKKCPVCKSRIKVSNEPPSDYEVTITK